MVELRKRPAPAAAPAPAAKRSTTKPRATSKAKQVVEKVKAVVTGGSTSASAPATGPDTISEITGTMGEIPETVGAGTTGVMATPDQVGAPASTAITGAETNPGVPAASEATTPLSVASINKFLPATALTETITTHDSKAASLSSLLGASQSGIVIFTYPKASTPGCTTQACLFRDNYTPITAAGYDVYGLSNDSEKANTGFKTKQNLPYTMLCDPEAKITGVLGLKKPGNAKGTLRGVVVVSKTGKVELWFQGGPKPTVDQVMAFVGQK